MARQGNLKDYDGVKIIPNTTGSAVYDAAKDQALSQTLRDTPDKSALGFPAFSTIVDYAVGDVVYYQNALKRFVAPHVAGNWDASEVED